MTQPATRARAGNAMARTRAGILDGARHCLVRFGTRKTTMGDIAKAAGVAKATLYNHFRTRADVYSAVAAAEVEELLIRADVAFTTGRGIPGGEGSPDAIAAVLADAARAVAAHPVIRRLADDEPGVLASLLRPDWDGPWASTREHLATRIAEAQTAGAVHPRRNAYDAAELVLRWVTSHAMWPTGGSTEDGARVIAHGLLAPPYAEEEPALVREAEPRPAVASLAGVRDAS